MWMSGRERERTFSFILFTFYYAECVASKQESISTLCWAWCLFTQTTDCEYNEIEIKLHRLDLNLFLLLSCIWWAYFHSFENSRKKRREANNTSTSTSTNYIIYLYKENDLMSVSSFKQFSVFWSCRCIMYIYYRIIFSFLPLCMCVSVCFSIARWFQWEFKYPSLQWPY